MTSSNRHHRHGHQQRPCVEAGAASIDPVLLVVWLIIGAIAAGQRHYYSGATTNCA
ncbi:MAG: hypothetical protein M3083_13545 [Actinomycetota bacterium]|nr:hypothetical protein [Actinomycetota bacterium]